MRDIVVAPETFAYDPSMSSSQAQDIWVERTPGLTIVAIDEGEIVGTAKMGPNHPSLGKGTRVRGNAVQRRRRI